MLSENNLLLHVGSITAVSETKFKNPLSAVKDKRTQRVHDEGSAVRLSLVQACKEDVPGSLPPGVTLGEQPLCISSIAIKSPVFHMHINELRILATFHSTKILSAGEIQLHSECDSNNRVCARTVCFGLCSAIYRVHQPKTS
ncbi:uncharacterized protein NPIL_148091 [Nephila pilipes]|uniref:Uncharacterized protein n=1 Tax=Nephila pilipes TaxID=299642 RepID=A0A8X6MDH9_NEPPI|nr:uncharacterized protein NPIL_148091 [Nephila pilipes]